VIAFKIILFFSPDISQFGLNLPFLDLDQLPVRLPQLPLPLDLLHDPVLNTGRK
jgi:hypothetical protein